MRALITNVWLPVCSTHLGEPRQVWGTMGQAELLREIGRDDPAFRAAEPPLLHRAGAGGKNFGACQVGSSAVASMKSVLRAYLLHSAN